MRILLGQNSLYYPAHGGGDKSNRLLIEALATRGHECRVVARLSTFGPAEQQRYLEDLAARGVAARAGQGAVSFERAGVGVEVVANANLRVNFAARVEAFRPEAILVSTDDPAQLLLEAALGARGARVVYLARATLALPFGPDCAFPSESKTARLRAAGKVVGASQYVADYVARHAGIPAVHVPISLLEREEWPLLGRFENAFVTLVNPCAVKGITIFLKLAEAFPETRFLAVAMWGTNAGDRAALAARRNVTLLDPVDDINRLLERTRVLLAPSLWAEARSRMVLEAMLRGVPVMAANVGGIPEAKMGVPYLLPVNPIVRYQTRLDEQMVPVAEVPPQEIGPWREALERLTGDRAHYEEIARASRRAALAYAETLTAEPFERLLEETLAGPAVEPRRGPKGTPTKEALSPERRALLALRLRQRAPAAAWFPGVERAARPRVFWFPHAGGGAGGVASLECVAPVRLPGRESRLAEAPFTRMAPLVAALANAMAGYLDQPFAFFGHSMGAVVAFELARELRRRGQSMPRMLMVSGARAPGYRLNHVAGPEPADEELLDELRRLEGTPGEFFDDEAARRAILPALRADTELYRHYVYREEPPLACPIRAYGGARDPRVTGAHLEAWAGETTATFAMRRFPGGHFYLQTAGAEFLKALAEDLEQML